MVVTQADDEGAAPSQGPEGFKALVSEKCGGIKALVLALGPET